MCVCVCVYVCVRDYDDSSTVFPILEKFYKNQKVPYISYIDYLSLYTSPHGVYYGHDLTGRFILNFKKVDLSPFS